MHVDDSDFSARGLYDLTLVTVTEQTNDVLVLQVEEASNLILDVNTDIWSLIEVFLLENFEGAELARLYVSAIVDDGGIPITKMF